MADQQLRPSARSKESLKQHSRERSSSVKRKQTSPDSEKINDKKHKNIHQIDTNSNYTYILDDLIDMEDQKNMTSKKSVMYQQKGVPSPHSSPVAAAVGQVLTQMNSGSVMPMTPLQGGCLSELDIFRIVESMKVSMKEDIDTLVKLRVEKETTPLKQEISILKKEMAELKADYNTIKIQQDQNEQYSRKTNVIIGNCKENEGEDVAQLIVEIAKKGDVEIEKSSIESCHRLGKVKDNKVRNIIVRFRSVKDKLAFVKSKQKLKEKKLKTYISDDLTKFRSEIAYTARQLKKEKKTNVRGTWVYNGHVYIETVSGDKLKINTMQELDEHRSRSYGSYSPSLDHGNDDD